MKIKIVQNIVLISSINIKANDNRCYIVIQIILAEIYNRILDICPFEFIFPNL